MPLTAEEEARYRELYPTLPLEGDRLTETGGTPIATGGAPQVGPSSITSGQEQLLTESRARQLALDAAPGMSTAQKLSLALAAGTDAAGQLAAIRRGKSPPASGAFEDIAKGIQAQGAKRQEQSLAERKFQADLLNNIGTSTSRDLEVRQKAYAILGDTLKNPNASEVDRQRAVTEATGFLTRAGQDGRLAGQVFAAMARPDMTQVATLMGDYAGAFKPTDEGDQKRLKLIESMVVAAGHGGPEAVKNLPTLVKGAIVQKVAPEVGLAVLETSRNLAGDPAFKDGIPMSVLYDKFEGKYGKAGARAYIDFLQGTLGTETPEGQAKYEKLQAAMVDRGFRGIDVAGRAQTAGATTRATAQANKDVKGLELEAPVRDALQGAGIKDPSTLDPSNPIHAAMIDAARKKVGITEPAQRAGAVTAATKAAELDPGVVKLEAARASWLAKATELGQNDPAVQKLKLDYETAKATALGQIAQKFKAADPASRQDVAALRDDFTKLSGDFIKTRDAQARIQAAQPNAAGDLSLIFSYMKVLDPGSTVREGEQASVAQARGVPETIIALYNKALSGEKLSASQRKELKDQATGLFTAQLASHQELETEFRRLATGAGINPEQVVVDYVGRQRKAGGAGPTGAKETPREAENRIRRANGLPELK